MLGNVNEKFQFISTQMICLFLFVHQFLTLQDSPFLWNSNQISSILANEKEFKPFSFQHKFQLVSSSTSFLEESLANLVVRRLKLWEHASRVEPRIQVLCIVHVNVFLHLYLEMQEPVLVLMYHCFSLFFALPFTAFLEAYLGIFLEDI